MYIYNTSIRRVVRRVVLQVLASLSRFVMNEADERRIAAGCHKHTLHKPAHTSAYVVSIRQHTSAYVGIAAGCHKHTLHKPAHTSAYVSIRHYADVC